MTQPYLGICAIFKNEAPYLGEWIAFHRRVGVERFYLYNNNSADDVAAAFAPFLVDGALPDWLQVQDWPEHPGQLSAYNHCLQHAGRSCQWLAMIDLDEFLVPQTVTSVPDVLRQHEDKAALAVNWRIFGSSGQVRPAAGPVTDRLQRAASVWWDWNRQVKLIVRPQQVIEFRHAHWADLHGDQRARTTRDEDVQGHSASREWAGDELVLHHYVGKSFAEFLAKQQRGRAPIKATRGLEYFALNDRNEVRDRRAAELLAGATLPAAPAPATSSAKQLWLSYGHMLLSSAWSRLRWRLAHVRRQWRHGQSGATRFEEDRGTGREGGLLAALPVYWQLLAGLRLEAGALISVAAVGAFAEAAAILFMLPLLSFGFGSATTVPVLGDWFGMATWTPGQALLGFCLAGTMAALAKGLVELGAARFRLRLDRELRVNTARDLLDGAWDRLALLPAGRINKAVFVDTRQLTDGADNVIRAASTAMIVAVLMLVEFRLAPWLTMLTVGFALAALALLRWTGRLAQAHARAASTAGEAFAQHLHAVTEHLKYCLATGRRDELAARLAGTAKRQERATWWTAIFGTATGTGQEVVGVLFMAAIVGGSLALSPARFVEAVAFLGVFYRIAPRLQSFLANYFAALVRLEWYYPWQSLRREALSGSTSGPQPGSAPPPGRASITMQAAAITLPGGTTIAPLTASFAPGALVAIAGPSGAGKSTVLDLLLGLRQPSQGRIEVGGQDLAQLDLDAWRRQLGVVLQDSPLVHGDCLVNIGWPTAAPDRQRAAACATIATADEVIEQLEAGWETILGEGGARLSGGQRQRLVIARALYHQPRALILDEAMSALDVAAEERILRNLQAMPNRPTIIYVSHRPSSLRFADQVIELTPPSTRVVQQAS